MNEPINGQSINEQPTPAAPVTPTGWAPQAAPEQTVGSAPEIASAAQSPSTPFESSVPDLTGPSSPSEAGSNNIGAGMEPIAPKSNAGLIIILIVLIIIGGLVLAVWQGWLNFGNLLSSKPETSPSPIVTESSSPMPVTNKRDAARKTDLANLKTALQKYYNDKQSYPLSTVVSKASDPTGPLSELVPSYISQLPIDPLSPNKFYGYKSDGKSFTLSATLEDLTDSSGILDGELFLYQVTNTSIEPPLVGPDATTGEAVDFSSTNQFDQITPSSLSPTLSASPLPSPSVSATSSSDSSASSSSSSSGSTGQDAFSSASAL